jgi:hypothetical protein
MLSRVLEELLTHFSKESETMGRGQYDRSLTKEQRQTLKDAETLLKKKPQGPWTTHEKKIFKDADVIKGLQAQRQKEGAQVEKIVANAPATGRGGRRMKKAVESGRVGETREDSSRLARAAVVGAQAGEYLAEASMIGGRGYNLGRGRLRPEPSRLDMLQAHIHGLVSIRQGLAQSTIFPADPYASSVNGSLQSGQQVTAQLDGILTKLVGRLDAELDYEFAEIEMGQEIMTRASTASEQDSVEPQGEPSEGNDVPPTDEAPSSPVQVAVSDQVAAAPARPAQPTPPVATTPARPAQPVPPVAPVPLNRPSA